MFQNRWLKPASVLMGRMPHGADLLTSLTDICIEKQITLGWIQGLGALQRARLGYYHQETQTYAYFDLDQHLEVLNLTGNVSVKDGKPMVHAHVTLADSKGRCYGGHLAEGTLVFACEYQIHVFEGDPLVRQFDEVTGLTLWD